MSIAERLIEQTFTKAGKEVSGAHTAMILGALKAVDGHQVCSIVLVDNGLAGLKLVALTTRGLFVIDNRGGMAAQHALADITELEISWGALTIHYALPGGGKMEHIYNLPDETGAYEMRREFNRVRQG